MKNALIVKCSVLILLFGCEIKQHHITYFENGNIKSKVPIRNGMKEGYATVYYPSGKIAERGIWSKDKQEGLWKFYYETGVVHADVWFNNGVQHGTATYYFQVVRRIMNIMPNSEKLRDKQINIMKMGKLRRFPFGRIIS